MSPQPTRNPRTRTPGRRQADGMSPEAWDLLTTRLDHQDSILDQILEQARATNGRVNALEQDKKIRDAVALEKAKDVADGDQRTVRKTDRLRFRITIAVGALATLAGGFASSLAHLHI